MAKRSLLAALVVFLVWSILDFLIHGVILASSYGATADLWRPPDEMKMGLMRVVVLIMRESVSVSGKSGSADIE